MTDTPDLQPASRNRLLRFLVPVLLAHALLLAALPYWWDGEVRGPRSMDVQLAPIATHDAPAPRPDRQAEGTPGAVEKASRDTAPSAVATTASPAEVRAPADTPAPTRPEELPTDEVAERTAAPAPTSAAMPEPTGTPEPVTAQATPATDPPPDWRPGYRRELRAALAQHHHYPPRARRLGLSGEVRVGFTIARDGRFEDIHLVRRSDAELLDLAALDTVRRLGHFRPLPAGYSGDAWAVEVPLVYRLD